MHSSVRRISALIVMLLTNAAAPAAITYAFVDYPTMQNGYTLTGQITTDGTIGTYQLEAGHVLSWDFSLTGGAYAFSDSSLDPDAYARGTVTVTSTTISVNLSAYQNTAFGTDSDFSRIVWSGPQTGFPPFVPDFPAKLFATDPGATHALFDTPITGSPLEDNGLVIAEVSAVPETATTLPTMALVAGGLLIRRRSFGRRK